MIYLNKKVERQDKKGKVRYSMFYLPSSKSGFTLLFASLIVSLLLSVSLAILQITYQQYILSSAGRESQYAFYNADTGVECALYFDSKGSGFFATDTPSTSDHNAYIPGGSNTINCSGQTATISQGSSDPVSATTIFKIIIDPNHNQCPGATADATYNVVVYKYALPNGTQATQIQSRGYNSCNINNPQRVERGLQVDY